jgi:glutathione S-transferase
MDKLSRHNLILPGPQAGDALQREAMDDALAEAMIRRFDDQFVPRDNRLERVVARQQASIFAIFDRLVAAPECTWAPTDPRHLAITCALGYLDGRSPELAWNAQRRLLET